MNNIPAAHLKFAGVQVRYPGGRSIELALEVQPGEFFGLMGASGSGKTTAIKVAAGLIRSRATARIPLGLPLDGIHEGSFQIDGVDASAWEPARRQVALIGQQSTLYPHLTVRQNLELVAPGGLSVSKLAELTEELGIAHTCDRRPDEISGGENRRASLAKAMVNRSRSVLWDEPFSGLDMLRRLELTETLRAFHKRHRPTTIFVSHDQETLLALSDRVAFLHEGRILQIAAPRDLLHAPDHVEVAQALDPGFRVRLPVALSNEGFTAKGLRCRGAALPADTAQIVINTRLIGSEPSPTGWVCEWEEREEELFGGHSVLLHFFPGQTRPWRVPLNGATPAAHRQLFVSHEALSCFAADGRRLPP